MVREAGDRAPRWVALVGRRRRYTHRMDHVSRTTHDLVDGLEMRYDGFLALDSLDRSQVRFFFKAHGPSHVMSMIDGLGFEPISCQ